MVTIQSTKFIRRVAVEDPWSQHAARAVRAAAAPPRATRERQEALGSGFIVDTIGIVLTNNHVVAGADEVLVKLADNRQLAAKRAGQRSRRPTSRWCKLDKPPAICRR